MHKLLHHLRRNRSYSSQERWGVFGLLLVLTILVSAGGWLLFGKPAASATTLFISQIEVDKPEISINEEAQATITVLNKTTNQPAGAVWVGLQVANPSLRTPRLTYYDWYSPKARRAFFQTDEQGQVRFPLMSDKLGQIEYQIYAGNPEMANDTKYQNLGRSFGINFIAP